MESRLIKLLVIDDDPDIRHAIKQNFKRTGNYRVLTANGGIIGKIIASQKWHKPDVILLDIMMPDMDGFEVLRILRKNKETAYIPIIMVTAKADCQFRVKAEGLYCDDYIIKPVELTELKSRIEAVLAKRGIKVENYLSKK